MVVLIEGVDGDIHLPNPLIAVDELMRAAAAMRVEIKDEHGAGACIERRANGEDKTIAESCSAGSPGVVKLARERPETRRVRSASMTAATTPPLEVHTISQSAGSQGNPCDSASSRGLPLRTASTYSGSWTRLSAVALIGSGATSATSAMGSHASDSAIHPAFRVVSKEWAATV
jgi:hypothetical protein